MNVNLFGTMQLTLACIPSMKEHGGGSIVMVTRKPLASQGGYVASKSALKSATNHLALELGQCKKKISSDRLLGRKQPSLRRSDWPTANRNFLS